ncbi:MAG: hypothetical protein JWM06_1085 [Actinomycetia bacterium]|nr:hypothetical protein [Actinomycetes bacterium]
MPVLRRFGLLCATSAGAAVLAGPTLAARPALLALPNSIGTTHFVVHFQSDPTVPGAATQTTAGWIAAKAETAYSTELADGYAAPLSDAALGGDARTDIYIADLSTSHALGLSIPDTANPQTSGYILLDGTTPEQAFTAHTISHELFHLIQFGIWATGGWIDDWLYEGTAEWMGYRSTGYDTSGGLELGPADMSVDCSDPQGLAGCHLSDPYANGGYSRWGFFEYLGEKFGASFVKDVFTQAASSGTAISGLVAALTAKGTTLADTYNAWTIADMSGGYSVSALQAYRPAPLSTVSAGAKAGTIFSKTVAVNHLASEYIAFTKGDGDSSHPCFAGTLSLTVAIPAGTLSKPAFFWDAKDSAPVQLSVNGATASASVPWDTCNSSKKAYLSLPNASQAVDGAAFSVTASLAIDTSKPVTATPPPDLVALPGVITVPTAAVVPTIEVFGPEVLKLSATTLQVRLIVAASGEGTLKAQLGSLSLGAQTLRGGNNDVRFTLPKGTLAALRRSAAMSNVLTLTPVAANGVAAGPSVTRKISVSPAKKTKRHGP